MWCPAGGAQPGVHRLTEWTGGDIAAGRGAQGRAYMERVDPDISSRPCFLSSLGLRFLLRKRKPEALLLQCCQPESRTEGGLGSCVLWFPEDGW